MTALSQTAPLDETDIVARIEAAGEKVARVQKAAEWCPHVLANSQPPQPEVLPQSSPKTRGSSEK